MDTAPLEPVGHYIEHQHASDVPGVGVCMVYTRKLDRWGYANHGRALPVHVELWLRKYNLPITAASVPAGFEVVHRCKVRACVRLDHLDLCELPATPMCTFEGCGRASTTRYEGVRCCAPHYKQLWKGQPLRPLRKTIVNKDATCYGPGCTRAADTKGLCQSHYMQQLRGYVLTVLTKHALGPVDRSAPCIYPGCTHLRHGHHGLCHSHYYQQYKGSELTALRDPFQPVGSVYDHVEERSASRVAEMSPCWIYVRKLNAGGYGDHGGKSAHVLTLLDDRGLLEVPPGQLVRHRCDVRACVRPDHLELGTPRDNAQDRVTRGAREGWLRGEDHGRAKLTAADVLAARQRFAAGGIRMQDIAQEYSISTTTISSAIRGRTWTDLPGAIKRGKVKLTVEEVNSILESSESNPVLANRFGTTPKNIGRIRNGHRFQTGKNGPDRRLSPGDIADIKRIVAETPEVTNRALACTYNVSPPIIGQILRGDYDDAKVIAATPRAGTPIHPSAQRMDPAHGAVWASVERRLRKNLVVKFNPEVEDYCWEWNRYRMPSGHGQIGVASRVRLAHRVAFALWVRPIEDGEQVNHACNNPACCKPEHLYVGTQKENVRDALDRGTLRTDVGFCSPKPPAPKDTERET